MTGLAKNWLLFTYRDCIFIACFQTVCRKAEITLKGNLWLKEAVVKKLNGDSVPQSHELER